MYEKPLERLNYFNGQRLEAADLKTEQDYHIRTRRWLNKSLYSAGIARGLEVRAVPPDPVTQAPPCVGVSCGLAIDDDGREIILLEEVLIEVCSYSGTGESTVVGNYLVIEYAEETLAFERNGGCGVRETGARTSTSTTNFGGPSRVQAKPKFSWIPFAPQPGSNQIALARVELGSDCTTVHQIDTGIRRYIGAASAAKVRQYALEGERHIDKDNSGRIYFHIRGRQPNSVTLYLRAERFSTLYYTEMGQHDHKIIVNIDSLTLPSHWHSMPSSTTEAGTSHTHNVSSVTADADTSIWGGVLGAVNIAAIAGGITAPMSLPLIAQTAVVLSSNALRPNDPMALTLSPRPFRDRASTDTTQRELGSRVAMSVTVDGEATHTHPIPGRTNDYPADGTPTTFHLTGYGSSDPAGVSDLQARSSDPDPQRPQEKALTYVDDLQVFIGQSGGGVANKTREIVDQLRDAHATETWDKLGNGTAGHVLAVEGTRAIRLDFLPGATFSEGKEYVIDLRVARGGGRILYNLYIE